MGESRSPQAVMRHDGTHLIDAIQFLTRRTLVYHSMIGEKSPGTFFLMNTLESTNRKAAPVPCVIELGTDRSQIAFEITLSFEEGRLRIGNGLFEVWENGPCPYAEGFHSLKKVREDWKGKIGYFANMLSDAVACVRNPARRPLSSAEDALSVMQYLEDFTPR
jgi:hypothetical protein